MREALNEACCAVAASISRAKSDIERPTCSSCSASVSSSTTLNFCWTTPFGVSSFFTLCQGRAAYSLTVGSFARRAHALVAGRTCCTLPPDAMGTSAGGSASALAPDRGFGVQFSVMNMNWPTCPLPKHRSSATTSGGLGCLGLIRESGGQGVEPDATGVWKREAAKIRTVSTCGCAITPP